MDHNSNEISFSIRLGLFPTAIIAVAVVACFLMVSHAIVNLPAEVVQVQPTPVYVNPTPVTVQNHITVRPRITIKKIDAPPPHIAAYDMEITVTPTPEQLAAMK
jgi:hypothetical protein